MKGLTKFELRRVKNGWIAYVSLYGGDEFTYVATSLKGMLKVIEKIESKQKE